MVELEGYGRAVVLCSIALLTTIPAVERVVLYEGGYETGSWWPFISTLGLIAPWRVCNKINSSNDSGSTGFSMSGDFSAGIDVSKNCCTISSSGVLATTDVDRFLILLILELTEIGIHLVSSSGELNVLGFRRCVLLRNGSDFSRCNTGGIAEAASFRFKTIQLLDSFFSLITATVSCSFKTLIKNVQDFCPRV